MKVEERSPLQMDTRRPLKQPNKSQRHKRTEQSPNDARKKQKERRKKRRRRQQSSTALHRGLELPNASTFHGERRAARSLARSLNIFFFFKGKKPTDCTMTEWTWLKMKDGLRQTMRLWVTLLLWAPSCSSAQNWKAEQLLSENSSAVSTTSVFISTCFVIFCWLGNKINVERKKKEMTQKGWIHPSSVSVKIKWYSPSDRENRWCRCHQQAPVKQHRNTCWAWRTPMVSRIPPVSQATAEKPCVSFSLHTVCETARLDDRGQATAPTSKDLK